MSPDIAEQMRIDPRSCRAAQSGDYRRRGRRDHLLTDIVTAGPVVRREAGTRVAVRRQHSSRPSATPTPHTTGVEIWHRRSAAARWSGVLVTSIHDHPRHTMSIEADRRAPSRRVPVDHAQILSCHDTCGRPSRSVAGQGGFNAEIENLAFGRLILDVVRMVEEDDASWPSCVATRFADGTPFHMSMARVMRDAHL
jgi:hypothetical protein